LDKATVGFRVKSGWSVAVLLAGTPTTPILLDVRRVELADPAVPDSMQPYHAGLEGPKDGGPAKVAGLVQVVERFAQRSLGGLLEEYQKIAGRVIAAGIVVGSQVEPATIRNEHIRAHAEEGRLFRSVVVTAAHNAGLATLVVAEKNLYVEASSRLGKSLSQLKNDVSAIGRSVTGGWRSEEKAAALAAWMVADT
jgi:hypothetical protein